MFLKIKIENNKSKGPFNWDEYLQNEDAFLICSGANDPNIIIIKKNEKNIRWNQ